MSPACLRCGRPIAEFDHGDASCRSCATNPPSHSGVIAACIYNDGSRDLVLRFKHGGKITLARLLGRMMATRLPDAATACDAPPLLVPVPLHRLRLWQRGYNQAALLAHELERLGKGELCVDALVRKKRTPSLGGLGREARERALEGAIAVRRNGRNSLEGRDVLLVDDVYTSGSTAAACTRALLDGGARSVRVVCFARVTDA